MSQKPSVSNWEEVVQTSTLLFLEAMGQHRGGLSRIEPWEPDAHARNIGAPRGLL